MTFFMVFGAHFAVVVPPSGEKLHKLTTFKFLPHFENPLLPY